MVKQKGNESGEKQTKEGEKRDEARGHNERALRSFLSKRGISSSMNV